MGGGGVKEARKGKSFATVEMNGPQIVQNFKMAKNTKRKTKKIALINMLKLAHFETSI